jgi:hypothetical protein
MQIVTTRAAHIACPEMLLAESLLPPIRSRLAQVVVLQRQRADAAAVHIRFISKAAI